MRVFMKNKDERRSFFVLYNYQAYMSSVILSFFSISPVDLLFLIDIDRKLVLHTLEYHLRLIDHYYYNLNNNV